MVVWLKMHPADCVHILHIAHHHTEAANDEDEEILTILSQSHYSEREREREGKRERKRERERGRECEREREHLSF